MASMLNQYSLLEGSGVYITWDRMYTGATPVDHYRILYSSHRDGTYTSIDTVDWPENEYIDQTDTADIQNYYKIQEEDAANNVLASSQPLWGEELLLRASLAFEMDAFLRVPVYGEELHFINEQRTIGYTASWGPWCYFERPRVYISRAPMGGSGFQPGAKDAYMILPQKGTTNLITQVDPSGGTVKSYSSLEWYADYNGRIYFIDSLGAPVSIDWYDSIFVDYYFQAFTTRELNDALFLAAGEIISRPGISQDSRVENYGSIGDFPRRWDFALVAGASYWLLRRLATMLLQRERRLVFLDPDGKIPEFSALMQEYKKQFDTAVEQIQKETRPQIGVNVVPEYALPGQRSRFFRFSFKGY
jgi:hypothetical protein